MEKPFALHITWTCYGTWLPGDERGHVSNTLLENGGFLQKSNLPGTPPGEGDAYTRERAEQAMLSDMVMLTRDTARRAAQELVEATRKRSWRILRASLMPNHIHVVVMDCPNNGPVVRRVLKGCSQAALCNLVGKNTKWWTAGESDRYKNDWPAIENAVNYVRDQVGKLVEIVDMDVRDCP